MPFADLEARVRRAVAGQGKRLARVLGVGAMAELTPPELVAKWVEEAVDVSALTARLGGARVVARELEEGDG